MSSRKPAKDISCTRCKIRCNKAHPRCDKCEAIDEECIYLPRKARDKKKSSGVHDKDVISDILKRLERLEKRSSLKIWTEENEDVSSMRSASSVPSDSIRSSHATILGATFMDRLKGNEPKPQHIYDVLYQIRYAGSNLIENQTFTKALEAAMTEVETNANMQADSFTTDYSPISKEMAKKWTSRFLNAYQFEGFRSPLEKDFVLSIPDLLEIRHVKLDSACLIIYYNSILQGMLIDSDEVPDRGGLVQHLYWTCAKLVERWRDEIENTYTDFYAAFLMISMSFEVCNIELAWETFGFACTIAKALGYFSVDEDASERSNEQADGSIENESAASQNRKRYEFWYLLSMDCMFRLYFGKPALISGGKWVVNFPDPTVDGVDDASSRFIQIHFLASMRLNLVLLKYIDLTDKNTALTASYDDVLDNLAEEASSIMSSWKVEDLLETTHAVFDTWFCADILFNGYKILIVLQQSKNRNQQSQRAPSESVDIARASIKKMQILVNSSPLMYWGTCPILLHQLVPFLVLCSNIVGPSGSGDIEADLTLITWLSDFVCKTVVERVYLSPIRVLVKAMTEACQQIALSTS